MQKQPPSLEEIAGHHRETFEMLYKEVDPQGLGIIQANDAASFMKRSNLSVATLGKVWEIADYAKRGSLDKTGFFIALKLISMAQQRPGIEISHLLLSSSDCTAPSIASRASTPSLPAFGQLQKQETLEKDWAIDIVDRQKYDTIFDTLNPVNGKLAGDKVRPVLLNSGLPANVLGKIWDLSDIDRDGQLDRPEMSVALHLVYRALQNQPVPDTLPQSLVPPSKRRQSLPHHMSGSLSGSISSGSTVIKPPGARKPSAPPGIGGGGVPVLSPPVFSGAQQRSRTSSVASLEGAFGQPPTQMIPAGRSLSVTPMTMPPLSPPTAWIINKGEFEAEFVTADTDRDGLVNGADVKDVFMRSGLSQNYLAHIWTLVDISKSGKLNLEQFALAMYLMRQKLVSNEEPPPSLPPDLIPPSFRAGPAGMTDTATSTNIEDQHTQMGSYGMPPVSSGNKEIDDLNMEIEHLREERRNVDSQVVQLEADMKVKQSEVKNLEIELHTLESTVKQLDRQKMEAGRRLADLDAQRQATANQLCQLQDSATTEQTQMAKMRAEMNTFIDTAKSQEELLNVKRSELQSLRDDEHRLDVQLHNEMASLDTTNQQYGMLEAEIGRVETEEGEARRQIESVQRMLIDVDKGIGESDWHSLGRLVEEIQALNLQNTNAKEAEVNVVTSPDRMTNALPTYDIPPAAPAATYYDQVPGSDVDPFATSDPFGGGDNAFSDGGVDPFGSAPAATGFDYDEDPFASNKDPFGLSSGRAVKGPPRPAPPKNRSVTPKNNHLSQQSDPFSSSEAADGTNGGFADFANFAAFS